MYFQSSSFDAKTHTRITFLNMALTEYVQYLTWCKSLLARKLFQSLNANESGLMLQEYKRKLARVSLVRKELRSRIQNLPDLSRLPNVTGSHMHLPFAGDIYSEDWWTSLFPGPRTLQEMETG